MTTQFMKHILPLAALALISAACDPFPAKPGGDPAVVRVIVSAGSTAHAETVENPSGSGTVTNDRAWRNDRIYIHFNKPMDGSTIQQFKNYNDDGTRFVPPGGANICAPLASFTLTNFAAGTLVCYSAGSVTDGGMAVITPGAPMDFGVAYNVAATVKDYEGKSLAINVTVTVDARPIPYGLDGYTAEIKWYNSPTAVSYDINRSLTAGGPFTPLATGLLPADVCFTTTDTTVPATARGACYVDNIELLNDTEYYYQVVEVGGANAGPRPAAQKPATTFGALENFLSATTAGSPPAAVPGVIAAVWYQIVGATGYEIERAPDANGAPGTWGTPVPVAADPVNDPMTYTDTGLTSGTTYWYRITPTYTPAFAAEKGAPASLVAP